MRSKYVLVKSYYGMGGDLCVLLGALRYAQENNRPLVADWSGGLYGESNHGNLFNEFFEEPVLLGPANITNRPNTVFPDQWYDLTHIPPRTYISGSNLTSSRPEDVPVDCDVECIVITRESSQIHRHPEKFFDLASSFRPVSSIRHTIDTQLERLKTSKHTIGIHYRHGNGEHKVISPDPKWFRNHINRRIQSLGLTSEDISLYISTDCGAALEYFKKYYPTTFFSEKLYRPNGEGAFHLNRKDLRPENKLQLGNEALVDMFVLSRCNSFIGSGGFFSFFIQLLRNGEHHTRYRGPRIFNNYEFSELFYPVKDDSLVEAILKQHGHPFDGLFVRITPQGKHLHYYDEPLYIIPSGKQKLSSTEALALRQAVVSRRIY